MWELMLLVGGWDNELSYATHRLLKGTHKDLAVVVFQKNNHEILYLIFCHMISGGRQIKYISYQALSGFRSFASNLTDYQYWLGIADYWLRWDGYQC